MKSRRSLAIKSRIPKELRALDAALLKIVKKEEILKKLAWPIDSSQMFLSGWARNSPKLPKINYPAYDLSKRKGELKEIIDKCKGKPPLFRFIGDTARSYHTAYSMLEVIGTKRFLNYSERLYGSTIDEHDPLGKTTHRAARRLLRTCRNFRRAKVVPESDVCLMPQHVQNKIQQAAKRKFKGKVIDVEIDPKLSSKAIAGIKRIRLRSKTCFADHDVRQLIEHELFVHTLTLINGREQPLKTLGISSPRTTCAQEGLAVFSEFITGAIDIARLTRVSARVQAIDMGIKGADFIDVFKFFLEQGQDEQESYFSTVRIFRGGKVTGGVVFTKDLVYLKGLIMVHRFLLNALQEEKFLYPFMFFSGRLTPEDIPRLEPFFDAEVLKMPTFKPDWIMNRSTLLAYLLSASVMTGLGLDKVG